MSFKALLLLLLSLLCCSFLKAQSEYLQVKAQKGDGIILLLGRYGLNQNDCNIDQFCKLNKLTKTDYLMEGKSYFLPLEKYVYNGKSIRSTINIDNWQIAKQIERYNDLMCMVEVKSEDFRKGKKELWCPHHLKECPSDLESFVPKVRNFAIFGEKYAEVPLKSQKLAGAVYYLVAGHGGPDPGAMSTYDGKSICEDEYAYDITLRLARRLLEEGALVYLITRDENDGIREELYLPCDDDETSWESQSIPINQKERLNQRSDAINSLYRQHKAQGVEYQRMVEIHVDSRSKSERIDLFFYYAPESLIGKKLAEKMQETIKSKYAIFRKNGEYYGSTSARDLHMLREVLPVSVFIEVANIQNKHDQKRILLASNRQALAEWLLEGLMKDY